MPSLDLGYPIRRSYLTALENFLVAVFNLSGYQPALAGGSRSLPSYGCYCMHQFREATDKSWAVDKDHGDESHPRQ